MDLSETQLQLLQIIDRNPPGYVTKTAEGTKDMMALAMKGLVTDVYETASGGLSGRLSLKGRDVIFQNSTK